VRPATSTQNKHGRLMFHYTNMKKQGAGSSSQKARINMRSFVRAENGGDGGGGGGGSHQATSQLGEVFT
jgi:hypothetical protein